MKKHSLLKMISIAGLAAISMNAIASANCRGSIVGSCDKTQKSCTVKAVCQDISKDKCDSYNIGSTPQWTKTANYDGLEVGTCTFTISKVSTIQF